MSRTKKGQTPLHVAVEMAESQWVNRKYDYGLTVQLLLGAGADVNAGDALGSTPLQVRLPPGKQGCGLGVGRPTSW